MKLTNNHIRRRGFTLVELLVVIGIIALLVSILLPSLNRARQYANLIQCQSNLRQMGIAVRMYATENQDYVPWGDAPGIPGAMSDGSVGTGTNIYYSKWQETLSAFLTNSDRTEDYGQSGVVQLRHPISPIFLDTDVVPGIPAVRVYTANIRVFGDRAVADPYRQTVLNRTSGMQRLFNPARLSSLNPSTDIAAIWCGRQHSITATMDTHHPINIGAASTTSRYMDTSAASASTKGYLIRELMSSDIAEGLVANVDPNDPFIDTAAGSGPSSSSLRVRHMNNTTINLLFVDGHVESKVRNELQRKLFAVPAPK